MQRNLLTEVGVEEKAETDGRKNTEKFLRDSLEIIPQQRNLLQKKIILLHHVILYYIILYYYILYCYIFFFRRKKLHHWKK